MAQGARWRVKLFGGRGGRLARVRLGGVPIGATGMVTALLVPWSDERRLGLLAEFP